MSMKIENKKNQNLLNKTNIKNNHLCISTLNNILLIPCYYGYEKQSLLLFYDDYQVRIMKLDNTTIGIVYN